MNVNKSELIGRIYAERHTQTCVNVLNLLDMRVNEIREENDEAAGDKVITNQGKIQAYKELRYFIIHGIPRFT